MVQHSTSHDVSSSLDIGLCIGYSSLEIIQGCGTVHTVDSFNLEKSANLTLVREKSGKLWFVCGVVLQL